MWSADRTSKRGGYGFGSLIVGLSGAFNDRGVANVEVTRGVVEICDDISKFSTKDILWQDATEMCICGNTEQENQKY